MKLKDIHKLEELKFVYKFVKNYLPKCFDNYFLPAPKLRTVQIDLLQNIAG